MTGLQAPASRLPGVLVASGSAVFLAASFTAVGQDVYSAENAAEVAAALEGSRTTWNVANLVSAAGAAVAALGLFLLGRDLGWVATERRGRRAASVVTWFGLATAVEVVLLIWNATASTDSLSEAYGDPTGSGLIVGLGLAWTVAALGTFVALGLALLWLRHQRWLGWFVLILGVVAALVLAAFAGPDPAYVVLLVAGIALAASPAAKPAT